MGKIAITTSGAWLGESDYLVDGHTITKTIEPDTDVAIVGTSTIAAADVAHLKGLVRLGVGYDNVPHHELREAGVALAYTPHAMSRSVAEHALALTMAALRFKGRKSPAKEMADLTVGMAGFGRIGKMYAGIISGLGPKDIGARDPLHYHDQRLAPFGITFLDSLSALLLNADVVSLHVPKEPQTIGMIGKTELEMMKPDAVLVNTSRGGIIDECALLDHLRSHPDFTAALDVFEVEPYAGPLLDCPNCIATPHVAAMTTRARNAMERDALSASVAILEGISPQWEVPEREPWHEITEGRKR